MLCESVLMNDKFPKVHLVSFADGKFKNRRDDFVNEAQEMDLFKSVTVYSFDSLDEIYKQTHRDFIFLIQGALDIGFGNLKLCFSRWR